VPDLSLLAQAAALVAHHLHHAENRLGVEAAAKAQAGAALRRRLGREVGIRFVLGHGKGAASRGRGGQCLVIGLPGADLNARGPSGLA
jgi:hypothetical protein